MFSKISILPLALIALGGSGLASASTYDEGQWVTTFSAGSNLISKETFSPRITGSVADLGSVDPSLAGMPASTTLDHLSFHDAFRVGPAFNL